MGPKDSSMASSQENLEAKDDHFLVTHEIPCRLPHVILDPSGRISAIIRNTWGKNFDA